eukprot:gene3340-1501_t
MVPAKLVGHLARATQVPKEYYDKFAFMTDDEGHCSAQTVKGVHTIDPRYPE